MKASGRGRRHSPRDVVSFLLSQLYFVVCLVVIDITRTVKTTPQMTRFRDASVQQQFGYR